MDQLSVVLARFPFANFTDYKIHPALIVSNSNFNKLNSNFLICPITSKERRTQFEIGILAEIFQGNSILEVLFE